MYRVTRMDVEWFLLTSKSQFCQSTSFYRGHILFARGGKRNARPVILKRNFHRAVNKNYSTPIRVTL